MFIDPTGEENMIYLVFMRNDNMKLTKSHINEILRISQRILDKAGANAQVQAVFRDTPYSDEELAKRDATDRTVYISDEATLKEHFPSLTPKPGDSNSGKKIGAVNAEHILNGFFIATSSEGDVSKLEAFYSKQLGSTNRGNAGGALAWIAKTAIHETFHTLPDDNGLGHSDDQKASRYGYDTPNPPLRGVGYYRSIETDNMMLSGRHSSSGERFPRERRPLLFSFLWQDQQLLKSFYGDRTPIDNFSKKVKP